MANIFSQEKWQKGRKLRNSFSLSWLYDLQSDPLVLFFTQASSSTFCHMQLAGPQLNNRLSLFQFSGRSSLTLYDWLWFTPLIIVISNVKYTKVVVFSSQDASTQDQTHFLLPLWPVLLTVNQAGWLCQGHLCLVLPHVPAHSSSHLLHQSDYLFLWFKTGHKKIVDFPLCVADSWHLIVQLACNLQAF